jgi:hypothetical protein
VGESPDQGKKARRSRKEEKREESKNLGRGRSSIPVHPVESRGRLGQARSVGIKFVSAANRLEKDFRNPKNIFCFGLALFV